MTARNPSLPAGVVAWSDLVTARRLVVVRRTWASRYSLATVEHPDRAADSLEALGCDRATAARAAAEVADGPADGVVGLVGPHLTIELAPLLTLLDPEGPG